MRVYPYVLFLAAACVLPNSPVSADSREMDLGTSDLDSTDLKDFETAPDPSPAKSRPDLVEKATQAIDSWFAGHGSHRVHVQLDRPLYRPGETVWFKTWNLRAKDFGKDGQDSLTTELVDPRGQVVETKLLLETGGKATNDFVLPGDAPGGKWMLRATRSTGEKEERPFIVASYQAPTIHKTLEFVREAYGPGDRVEALVELERGTGGPLAGHEVRALLQVDGRTVVEEVLKTDATGAVLVSAVLPTALENGDGLLTVLVEEGGVTESISRSVPIVLADMKLAFFPEGGDLVEDLPGRVYFEAQNRHGEPADVEGYITGARGNWIADFESVHDGMGRFSFTPEAGERYEAHVRAPEGIADTYPLPDALPAGCTVRSFDDLKSVAEDVRVAVRCSTEQEVLVSGVLREQRMDAKVVDAGPEADAVVYLEAGESLRDVQGAVRVTVFDKKLNPLAERLVYRNPGKDLRIELKPNLEKYGPRDEVVLDVKTTGPTGEPVAAEVALSVVDDAVVNFADDEEGHLLTRMYLEPELHDSPDDPAWYFDPDEELAARALDLVMGTRGWRHFEWHLVWNPPPPIVATAAETGGGWGRGMRFPVPMRRAPMGGVEEQWMVPMAPPMPQDELALAAPVAVELPVAEEPPAPMADMAAAQARDIPLPELMDPGPAEGFWGGAPRKDRAARLEMDRRVGGLRELGYVDGDDWGGGRAGGGEWGGQWGLGYASVRVFPAPSYSDGFTGVRTDFRDTVHWAPTVTTDKWGNAEVRFFLSDAITSFRVTAEGVGAGLAGHGEHTLTSVLPVSVATKLPPAVSVGDRILLPVTVSNTRAETLTVNVAGTFGELLQPVDHTTGRVNVAPDGKDTVWIPLDVEPGNADVSVHVEATGAGLTDTIEQTIAVVPSGFPRSWSASGEIAQSSVHSLWLDPVVPHSLTASVTWHPSTVSTLIDGMEGLIGTPGGCFEQTSSTNWPNVAILAYLEAHGGDPRLKVQSSQALEVGYNKLSGYQVDVGGFETWGSGPGKEALSAFGLLQFTDMQKVYPVSDAILERDATYLLSQRDGKGGFRNSGESSHGYGSAPPAVLDAFITYSLATTGHADRIEKEIGHQAAMARSTNDPYVLALATRTLLISKHPEANDALERLVAMQAADGSFPGAESSITRSYEANLLVESTSLAALAVMESGKHRSTADKAAKWIIGARQGYGTWGATQATALALGALTRYAEVNQRPRSSGELSIEVNGETVGTLAYAADQEEALTLDGWENALVPGKNKIVLRHSGGEPLPFTVDVQWRSEQPASDPGAELSLNTALDRDHAAMGETVRLTATIGNETSAVVPSPIARIGLPAGLEPQIWQLKQLQERGDIAFFETRPREVTLYWDGLHKGSDHVVNLDLVAALPGTYTGPASSAYPYYDDDEKAWDAGLKVEIAPSR